MQFIFVHSWARTRSSPCHGVFSGLTAVNPFARVVMLDPQQIPGAEFAWEISIDRTREAVAPSEYAELVAGADLMSLDLSDHQYHYLTAN